VIVDMAVYEGGVRRPGKLVLEDAYDASRTGKAFAWIGLYEPTAEEFDSVRREFDLHELAVEDAIKAHQRPKLEVFGDTVFVVLRTVRYDEEHEQVLFGEVQVFVGDGFIVTIRRGEADVPEVRSRMEGRPDLLQLGPSAALYAIVDRVVDDYAPVIDALEEDIGEVEAEVFSGSRANPAERIYKLKREVLQLHGAIAPLEDPLDRLEEGRFRLVADELGPYFRDVKDHVIRFVRMVEGFRESLTSILTANLTQASVRQNDDVRKISAWAAILAVPTLISGIYGMNFEHMPELGWTFGYPLALVLMAIACFVLYRKFRQSGWL
jgi:magnesium transporter